MDSFERHLIQLLESIEECYKAMRILPCLILVYSGIDVAASLEAPNEKVGARFENWVERYMLTQGKLNCFARDLYAARCAVVHTFTPDSDLSRKGKAKTIAYAFGSGSLAQLEDASQLAGQDHVSIHRRDLIDSFRNGFADFIKEVGLDSERWSKVKACAGLWYDTIGPESLEGYIAMKSAGTN